MRLHVSKKQKKEELTPSVKHDGHVKCWSNHKERSNPTELKPFLTDEEENDFKNKSNTPLELSTSDSSDDVFEVDLDIETNSQNIETVVPEKSNDQNQKESKASQSSLQNPVPRKHKLNIYTKLLIAYSVGISSYCGYELAFGKDARLEGKITNIQGMFSNVVEDYSKVETKLEEQTKVSHLLSNRIDEVATTSLTDFDSLDSKISGIQDTTKEASELAKSSKSAVEAQESKIASAVKKADEASISSAENAQLSTANKTKIEVLSKDVSELKEHADVIINRRNEAAESYKEYTTHINSVVAELSRGIKGASNSNIEDLIDSTLNKKLERAAFSAKHAQTSNSGSVALDEENKELIDVKQRIENQQSEFDKKLSQLSKTIESNINARLKEVVNKIDSKDNEKSAFIDSTYQKHDSAISSLYENIDSQGEINENLMKEVARLSEVTSALVIENKKLLSSNSDLHNKINALSKENSSLRSNNKELITQISSEVSALKDREKTILQTLKSVVNLVSPQG